MKKIFQKWTILSASEECLTITGLFESIQSRDLLASCFVAENLGDNSMPTEKLSGSSRQSSVRM